MQALFGAGRAVGHADHAGVDRIADAHAARRRQPRRQGRHQRPDDRAGALRPDRHDLGPAATSLGDGTVDINDLTIVLAHYGQSARLVGRPQWPPCRSPRQWPSPPLPHCRTTRHPVTGGFRAGNHVELNASSKSSVKRSRVTHKYAARLSTSPSAEPSPKLEPSPFHRYNPKGIVTSPNSQRHHIGLPCLRMSPASPMPANDPKPM